MLLHSINLTNFLSYGPESSALPLHNLNVIIGTNGSGKSNFLEAIALLKSTPQELVRPIRVGGRVSDWLWRDGTQKDTSTASVEVIVDKDSVEHIHQNLRYRFDFTESNKRFAIVDENIEYEKAFKRNSRPFFFYKYEHGHPIINTKYKEGGWTKRALQREHIDPEKSILAQRYDPEVYTEISYLADSFKEIRIYRDWTFGPFSPVRQAQRSDRPGEHLLEDMSNLSSFLSRLLKNRQTETKLLEYFKESYDGIHGIGFDIGVDSNEVYVKEGNIAIPPTRLSDGTLRLLCLLAVLCDPEPPRLICIDEPELGLHPDLVNMMADAIRYAAERTQVIVTTHSVGLVDAFTSTPEAVVVCEKEDGSTKMRRLVPSDLQEWLKDYALGQLWTRGHIGGTRW